jgi:MFS superfamily sulfate permease-like transporter
VGISNIISGLTGGYTGSYIFSQSIFSLRSGIRSPVAGYMLAAFQLIVVIAPFPILSYVPNFFFGALLSMICVDLMFEWLWEVRTRLSQAEYILTWSTFCLIQATNVEYGILGGMLLYLVCARFGVIMEDSRNEKLEDKIVANDTFHDVTQMPLVNNKKYNDHDQGHHVVTYGSTEKWDTSTRAND